MQNGPPVAAILPSLFNENPDAIVAYDLQGRIVACNQAASKLSGYSLDDLPARHFADHVPRADRQRARKAFEMAAHGFSEHFESTIRTREGVPLPIECHVFPCRSGGEIAGVFAQLRETAAQQRLRSLFEYHPDAIMMLRVDGRISLVNVALETATGYFGEHLIGRLWHEIIAPECHTRAAEAFRLASSGEPVEFEAYLLDRTGKRIDSQMKIVPLRVGEAVDGVYAIAKNITAQRTAERAMSMQSERIRDLYLAAASRGGTISSQIDMTLTHGCRLLGFDYGYVSRFDGETMTILNAVGDGSPIRSGTVYRRDATLSRLLREGSDMLFVPDLAAPPWDTDAARANTPWRSYLAAHLVVNERSFGAVAFAGKHPWQTPVGDIDRDLLQLIALFVAAALERSQNAERIEQLAFYDSLTGLPNRVLFAERLGQVLAAAHRYRQRFAVMYLDLDRFKSINDRYGHAVGDRALQAVAERLRAILRESDTIARFGGDEFVLLQPSIVNDTDAAELARKIIAAMQAPFAIGDTERVVHTSIGIALYPEHAESAEELMGQADRALYSAKNAGRNTWSMCAIPAEKTAERSR